MSDRSSYRSFDTCSSSLCDALLYDFDRLVKVIIFSVHVHVGGIKKLNR